MPPLASLGAALVILFVVAGGGMMVFAGGEVRQERKILSIYFRYSECTEIFSICRPGQCRGEAEKDRRAGDRCGQEGTGGVQSSADVARMVNEAAAWSKSHPSCKLSYVARGYSSTGADEVREKQRSVERANTACGLLAGRELTCRAEGMGMQSAGVAGDNQRADLHLEASCRSRAAMRRLLDEKLLGAEIGDNSVMPVGAKNADPKRGRSGLL